MLKMPGVNPAGGSASFWMGDGTVSQCQKHLVYTQFRRHWLQMGGAWHRMQNGRTTDDARVCGVVRRHDALWIKK